MVFHQSKIIHQAATLFYQPNMLITSPYSPFSEVAALAIIIIDKTQLRTMYLYTLLFFF